MNSPFRSGSAASPLAGPILLGGSFPPPARSGSRWLRWAVLVAWSCLMGVLVHSWLSPPEPEPWHPRSQWRGPGGSGVASDKPFSQRAIGAFPSDIWRIQIELAPTEVQKLRNYYWNGRDGGDTERTDAAATVREGGRTYTNVAIHIKGSAGSFRPFDDRPALTLNFAKNASSQRFHGMTKISLNNSVQDSTLLHEAICRELYNAAGVPVPKADHATVVVNGRDLGLYVLTEGWSKGFLKQHFKDVRGNLYDCGFVQDVDGNLKVTSGEKPEDHSDIERLLDAVHTADRTNRWNRLQSVLDVDRFITLVALDVMVCNWDGYAMNRNNYRIFHDRSTERLVFMPHGMDQVFGNRRMGNDSSIRPQTRAKVAEAVLSTPEGRRRYYERVAVLRTNLFLEDRLTNRVRELSHRIRPTLAAYGPDAAIDHDAEVADLCRRISDRVRSVTSQLGPSEENLKFDAAGKAAVSGWQPVRAGRDVSPSRFQHEESEGIKQLVLKSGEGPGMMGWRARVVLEPGHYRFEGRLRAEGVAPDGGVCLRAAGSPFRWRKLEPGTWVPLSAKFIVDDGEAEVHLEIAFAGSAGEVRIDEGSLKVIRE